MRNGREDLVVDLGSSRTNPDLQAEIVTRESEPVPEGSLSDKRLRTANTLLVVSVVVALVFLFILARKDLKLNDQMLELASNRRTISGATGSQLTQVGDLVPGFEALNIQGSRTAIHYDGKSKYLFFVFSPDCEVCVGEFPSWSRVAEHASSKARTVVGLSINPFGRAPSKVAGIDSSVCEFLAMPDIAVQRAYRVLAVPVVTLVSADGRVEWVHSGKLSEDDVSELFSVIDEK